jgi:hypothetical protein
MMLCYAGKDEAGAAKAVLCQPVSTPAGNSSKG